MAGERTFLVKFISDTLGFNKGIATVSGGMGSLKKGVTGLLPSFKTMAISGAAAFTATAAAAYKAVEGAAQDQKSQALLAQQLKATTGATFDQIAGVEEQIKTMMLATGIVDDKLRPAFAQLVRATGSVTEANDLMKISLDVSAGSGKELEAVTTALSKAATGNFAALGKLGIPLSDNIKKSKDMNLVTEELNKQFGGAAAVAADTFSGRLLRLKTGFGEVVESVGYALMPALEGAMSIISTKVMPVLDEFGSALSEGGISGGVQFIADKFKEGAPIVVSAIQDLLKAAIEWTVTTGAPALAAGLQRWAESLTGWIEPRIPMFISSIRDFLLKGLDWIYKEGLPKLVTIVQGLGDTLASFVGKAARQLPAQLVTFLGDIAKWVLSDGIPALLSAGTRLAGSLLKWTLTIGGQLIAGLGGAVVALVAALPDIFVGLVKGIANIAVNAVKGFVGKFDEMKTALANIAVSVVNTLIDVFNKIPLIPNIPKITVDTKKLGTQMGLTQEKLQEVNAKFEDVNGTLKVGKDALNDFGDSTDDASTSTGGAAKTLKTAKEKLKEYTDALKTSTSAQKAFGKAQTDTKNAQADLTKATLDVTAAQTALDKAVAGFGAGSPEAISAQRKLDQAQRSVERAGYRVEASVFAVADAERQLAEIRLDPESSPQAIREAEIALAEAKLSGKDAVDEQRDATDELATSQSTLNELIYGAVVGSDFYAQFSDALTEAKGRQEEATIRVADAIDREAEAQQRLNEANEKAAEIAKLYPKIAATIPNPMSAVVAQPSSTVSARYRDMTTQAGPQITINAGLGANGVQIGQELDQYLRDFQRLNGSTFSFGSI
jgi:hypothetical protein